MNKFSLQGKASSSTSIAELCKKHSPLIIAVLNIATLDDNVINISSCAGLDKGN